MINETEIKISLVGISKDVFVTMCLEKFPDLKKRESNQRDIYYDTEDMQLQKSDFVVRVRKKDNITMVALKSPRVYLSEYIQKRIELEFEVNDNFPFEQIESQGLKPVAIIEKKRMTLKGTSFVIEIDELPYIGLYAEIESTNQEIINDVFLTLSLESFSKTKKNYGELLDEKLSELGLPLRPNLVATFEKEKGRKID